MAEDKGKFKAWREQETKRRKEALHRKYADAVELYAASDLTQEAIAKQLDLSARALNNYLRRYHRELILNRYNGELTAASKYKAAVEACLSPDYLALNMSELARMFHVSCTGFTNYMHAHYEQQLVRREEVRQLKGLAGRGQCGMRQTSKEQYAAAMELYRTTDLPLPLVAEQCRVSKSGLMQYLRFYHKEIMKAKERQRQQAATVKQKKRGVMMGNGRRNQPEAATVMKYAAALALYSGTALTVKAIVAKTGVSHEGFRAYLYKWHKPLVLERLGLQSDTPEETDLRKVRRRMKTVAEKYAPAIRELKEHPGPVAPVAVKYGFAPDVFRQYLHKHEPELMKIIGVLRKKK